MSNAKWLTSRPTMFDYGVVVDAVLSRAATALKTASFAVVFATVVVAPLTAEERDGMATASSGKQHKELRTAATEDDSVLRGVPATPMSGRELDSVRGTASFTFWGRSLLIYRGISLQGPDMNGLRADSAHDFDFNAVTLHGVVREEVSE